VLAKYGDLLAAVLARMTVSVVILGLGDVEVFCDDGFAVLDIALDLSVLMPVWTDDLVPLSGYHCLSSYGVARKLCRPMLN
jgi:hypothetical protein